MSETSAKRKFLSEFMRNPDLYLSATAFVFVSCVTFLLVITRYLYSVSLPALEEVTMVVFVWFLYLSMIYCVRHNLHIKVEIVNNFVGKKITRIIDICADTMLIIFTSIMFYYAFLLVEFNFGDSGGSTPMIDMPYYVIYLVLPFSFGMFTFFLAIKIVRNVKDIFSQKAEKAE
jgi:C4-dicarboxylate transporter, DctQ subunit